MKALIQLWVLLALTAVQAAAQRQPRVVDSIEALVAVVPSATQPDILVSDSTNGWRSFRYLPGNTEDTNTSSVYGTKTGVGRWKLLPLLGQTNSIQLRSSESQLYSTDPINGYAVRVFTGATSVDWNWAATEGGPDVSGERIRPTNYVTGSWIAGTSWATAKSSSGLQGVGFDSSGRIVASTATKQQVDATAMQVATVAAMRALTPAQINDNQLIQTGGYYTNGDGGGALFKYLSSDTTATNTGAVLAPLSGSGRFTWVGDGVINVKMFGAKADFSQDDQPYIQSAINFALGREVYLPNGHYKLGNPILMDDLSASYGHQLIGDGVAGFDSGSIVTKGTRLTLTLTNSPAIRFGGVGSRLENISITATPRAASTDTSSVGVLVTGLYLSQIRNVSIAKFAYGLQVPSGTEFVSCEVNNVRVITYEIDGMDLTGSGTQSHWSDIYIGNQPPIYSESGTAAVSSGTNVVVSGLSASFVNQILPGQLVNLTGAISVFHTVTAVNSGAGTISMSLNSSATNGAVTVRPLAYNGSTGYNLRIGEGRQDVFTTLNLESGAGTGALYCAGTVSVDGLHIEHFSGNTASGSVLTFLRPAILSKFEFINSTFQSGAAWSFITTAAPAGFVSINGGLSTRDLYYSGGTLAQVTSASSALPVVADGWYQDTTIRWNRTSTFSATNTLAYSVFDYPQMLGSSGTPASLSVPVAVNQSGTAGYTGISVDVTETATGSGQKSPYLFTLGGTNRFRISNQGAPTFTVPSGLGGATATFRSDSTSESGMTVIYGTALDRNWEIQGNSANVTVRSTAAAATMSLQSNGGGILAGGTMIVGGGSLAAGSVSTVNGTTGGYGLPAMTTAQRDAISSPASRVILYDSTVDRYSGRTSGAWRYFTESLTGSVVWDIGSLASLANSSTTLTVTGANGGDIVVVSSAMPSAGVLVAGDVTSVNTVTLRAHNISLGVIDPPSQTFRVQVIKQ